MRPEFAQLMPDTAPECRLGDSDELEGYVATLRFCEEQLGSSHPHTLTAANRLGIAFWQAGYSDRAIGLLDQALDRAAAALGSDHPLRVDLLGTLGEILFEQRQLHQAQAIQREVLANRIRHSGENHPASLEAKGDLAAMLYELGQIEEAGQNEQEAFEGARAHLGSAHTVTTVLAWNRAMSCERLGDVDSARRIIVNELVWLLSAEPSRLEPDQCAIRTLLEERLNWAAAPVC